MERYRKMLIPCSSCVELIILGDVSSDICNDDAQDPTVDEIEPCASQPQTREECRMAEELQFIPLLKPCSLAKTPEDKRANT